MLERIHVAPFEASENETGWETFSLDYHVTAPIDAIFTPEVKRIYLRLFGFLWKLKRAAHCLTDSGVPRRNATRIKVPEMAAEIHRCFTTRHELSHFLSQLEFYLHFEVIESSWIEFTSGIRQAADLDHLIQKHRAFLERILLGTFLEEEGSTATFTRICRCLDLAVQFQEQQALLFSAYDQEINRRAKFATRVDSRTQHGQWGVTDEETQQKTLPKASRDQFSLAAQKIAAITTEFKVSPAHRLSS